jgi:hypothetical protein
MKNLLTAITAFCLTFGLLAATNNEVTVQRLELPEFEVRPNIQKMEFDGLYIEGHRDDYNFTEPEVFDDGDSKDVILNDRKFYCQVWPSKCLTK